jgi:hypothetical protein
LSLAWRSQLWSRLGSCSWRRRSRTSGMLDWRLLTRCCVGCDRAISGSMPESVRPDRPTRRDTRRLRARQGRLVGLVAASHTAEQHRLTVHVDRQRSLTRYPGELASKSDGASRARFQANLGITSFRSGQRWVPVAGQGWTPVDKPDCHRARSPSEDARDLRCGHGLHQTPKLRVFLHRLPAPGFRFSSGRV